MAGNERKGLSFTMTLAVVGLILAVTAAVVLSFSGSTITQFFSGIGGEQESNVDEFQVQNACNELKDRISSNYCQAYMPTDYAGPFKIDENGDTGTSADCYGGHGGVLCGDAYSANNMGEYGSSSPYWPVTQNNCASSTSDVEANRVLPSEELTNESGTAYISTGVELGCAWPQAFDTRVTVEGETFDCLEDGYIQSDSCPVQ